VRWVDWVVRYPRTVLLVVALLTVVAAWVSLTHYAMNSRLGDLVTQQADWRDDYESYQAAFPQLVETAMVVVTGQSFTQVEETALALERAIKADKTHFADVYAPANEAFFRDHALLLMELERLDEVTDTLAEAQPLLSAVAEEATLHRILTLVNEGLGEDEPAGFSRILRRLTESAAKVNAGQDATVPWADEFFPATDNYRIIFLRGLQNYGATLPNAEIVARLRTIIADVLPEAELAPRGLQVRLTGEVALRHDEVEAAVSGVQIAGGLALLLLGTVLAFGVRSGRIVAATFAVLLVGVVWTSAWALLSVGSYNTLSLVFLVMFFGLGVDFCVHYCLRLQEAAAETNDVRTAFAQTTRSVGPAVLLCTVTTAIGFLGFLPTPYKGLADLGVISAGGMGVACVLTFTLLPALFALMGLPRPRALATARGSDAIAVLVRGRAGVLGMLVVLVAGCLWLAPRMTFDYSVLALRDPDAESMQTLRELQREGQITDYAMYSLLPREALTGHKRDLNLPTVKTVTTPFDYVPADLEDKLFALEDLQELLGDALLADAAEQAATEQPPDTCDESCFRELRKTLEQTRVAASISASPEAAALALELELLARAPDQQLRVWQQAVVDPLRRELGWLRRAVAVQEFGVQDLPGGLRARLIAPDGRYLSAILPANDITPVDELSRFITSVRDAAPHATGRPVVEWGVGNIVVSSFYTALLVALIGISSVLVLVLRSVRDALLVLTPLLLAALFTLATSVAFSVPLNMASVLVLPLVFGLGVDNGIHMVERFHGEQDSVADFMRSSTPRAVLLSTLTTIGTFAALMLSPHAGTASIGFLLTVAVGYLLLFTVVVLPLLLSFTANRTNVVVG